MGMIPLHVLCSNPGATLNMIKQLGSKNINAALARNSNGMTPLVMYFICNNFISYRDYQQQAHGERSDIITLIQDRTYHTVNEIIGMELGYVLMHTILAFNGQCIEQELYKREQGYSH